MNLTGTQNIAIGATALSVNTTGCQNTASGFGALQPVGCTIKQYDRHPSSRDALPGLAYLCVLLFIDSRRRLWVALQALAE